MIVRPAETRDVPEILRLGKQLHSESGLVFPPFDDEKARNGLEMMAVSDVIFAHVAERGGRIVGGLSGFMSGYFFASPPIALQDIFYIEKAARGTSAALRLVKAFEAWATERGAWELRLHEHSAINTERAEKFFNHMGYEPLGMTFRKVF